MRKKWLSVALAVVMTFGSVSPAIAESFDVGSEESLLEDSLSNGDVVDATSGISVGGDDSSSDSGEVVASDDSSESVNSTESVDNSVNPVSSYRIDVKSTVADVVFKDDLEALKAEKSAEDSGSVTDNENNDVEDLSSGESSSDTAVNLDENNGYANVSSYLPSEYLSLIDSEDSYKKLANHTDCKTYESGKDAVFYVVPYDTASKLAVNVYDGTGTVEGKLLSDGSYSYTVGNSDAVIDVSLENGSEVVEPTEVPAEPTETPAVEPTVEPTETPTVEPAVEPTETPTVEPTETPDVIPEESKDAEELTQDTSKEDMDVDDKEDSENPDEDEITEEYVEENCTCDNKDMLNPYLHDFDCPVFTENFLKDCSCGHSDDKDISKHDFNCQAVINSVSNNCDCEMYESGVNALHEDCSFITKIHRYLCDCGKEFRNSEELIDNHAEGSAPYEYIMRWADYINSQISATAIVPGTKEWGSESIGFVQAATSFATDDDSVRGTVTVSGASKIQTEDKSYGTATIYYKVGNSSNTWNSGNYLTARIRNCGTTYINGKRTNIDVGLKLFSNDPNGFCLMVYRNTKTTGLSKVSIADGAHFTGKHASTANNVGIEFSFYKTGTEEEISLNGTMQVKDLDVMEAVKFIRGFGNVYTTSNTKLRKNNANWYVGTEKLDNADRRNNLQVLYSTSPSSRMRMFYRSGDQTTQFGMNFGRDCISVRYHLTGTVPSGVKTPATKLLASGANTQDGVKNYDLTPSLTASGYTFSGWRTGSATGTKYTGVTCAKSDIDLYGTFSKLTGNVTVKKVVNASFKSSMPEKKKTFKFYLEGTSTSGETVSKNLVCKDGQTVSFANIPVGTYTVREAGAGLEDDGYIAVHRFNCKAKVGTGSDQVLSYVSGKGYTVGSVKVTNGGTTAVVFTNTPKTGNLTVTKRVDNGNSDYLSGLNDADKTFTFTLTGISHFGTTVNVSKTIVGTGSVTFSNIPTGGGYKVTESFKDNLWSCTSVTSNDAIATGAKTFSYSQSTSTATATFTNKFKYYGSYAVKKVDKDDHSKVLTGAEFTLYEYNSAQNTYVEKGKLTWVNAEKLYKTGNLMYTSSNQGKFKIVETKNPPNYSGKWTKNFTLAAGAKDSVIVAENSTTEQNYGTITITKIDSVTGKDCSDHSAEFTIYEYNKINNQYEDTVEATARSFKSIESGNNKVVWDYVEKEYRSKNLYITDKNQGKFKVVETKNPLGYTGSWDKYFTLTPNVVHEELEFTVENTPTKMPVGQIVVNKSIKESDIHWAHGNPTFRFTVSGTDTNGVRHTYQDFVEFRPGNYTKDGNGNAILSVMFNGVPTGTYEITEAKTIRYSFGSCARVTSNVTEKGTYLQAVLSYNKSSGTVPKAEGTFYNNHTQYDQYSHTDVSENIANFVVP